MNLKPGTLIKFKNPSNEYPNCFAVIIDEIGESDYSVLFLSGKGPISWSNRITSFSGKKMILSKKAVLNIYEIYET
tara:strand:+ start:1089 stop:1316 length:228 start_codon:yes stop_codon:yes gene_type:complete